MRARGLRYNDDIRSFEEFCTSPREIIVSPKSVFATLDGVLCSVLIDKEVWAFIHGFLYLHTSIMRRITSVHIDKRFIVFSVVETSNAERFA
jgi:hypothetical protein